MADAEERAAKAARAKALLKKHQKKKAGGNTEGPPSRASTPGPDSPLVRSAILSPATHDAHELSPSTPNDTASREETHPPPSLVIETSTPAEAFQAPVQQYSAISPSVASPGVNGAHEVDYRTLVQTQQQTISLLVAEKAGLSASLEQLAEFEQKFQHTQAELDERQGEVERLNSRIEALEEDVQSSSVLVSSLLGQDKDRQEKHQALERELEMSKREVQETSSRLRHKETQLRELEEQIQADDRVENLEKSLKTHQERAESLEFQLTKSKQLLARTKTERDEFEEKIQTHISETEEWKQKHSSLQADHDATRAELAMIVSERDTLQATNSDTQSQLHSSQTSLTELQQKLAQVSGELGTATRNLQSVQSELVTAQRRATDGESMQKSLQSENMSLLASLEEMRPKIVELTGDKVDLGERIESLNKNLRERDSKISELESDVDQYRSHADERRKELETSTSNWEKEKARLEKVVAEATKSQDELHAELETSRAGVLELEAERTNSRQIITRQQAELDRLKSDAQTASHEGAVLRGQLEERDRTIRELQELHNDGQGLLDELRADVTAKEEEIAQLKDQIEISGNEKGHPNGNGSTSLNDEMLKAVQQQHALDLSSARSQIRNLETAIFQEQERSHALQRRIGELEEQLTQAHHARHAPHSGINGRSSPARHPGVARAMSSSPMPSPPTTNHTLTIDATLTPDMKHKRRISLSMLKARMDSEIVTPGSTGTSPRPPLKPDLSFGAGGLQTVVEPSDGEGSIHSTHIVKRSQFGDDSHIFWCSACRGDLVVL